MTVDELIDIIDARGGGGRDRRLEAVDELVANHGSPAHAVPAIVRLFARSGAHESAHERLAKQLPSFGSSIVEPLLHLLEVGLDRDTGFLGNTCEALVGVASAGGGGAGAKDERIFARIRELFDHHDPWWGAKLFGIYGDAKAVPILGAAIELFEPQPEYSDYLEDLDALLDAHERCGGVLDEKTKACVNERKVRWRRARLSVVKAP